MDIEQALAEHKKWLRDEGGQRADLWGANLREANLQRADLREANLREANLRRADLREADLWGANLRRANLLGADLREADLREADLWEANLRRADLREASLRRANLRGADLDLSAWPLSCGSFDVEVDDRILAQLFAHIARLDVSGCSPVVRYAHRLTFSKWPGKWLKNLFCEYRNDVSRM